MSAESTGGIEGPITLQAPVYVTVAGYENPHASYSLSSNLCRDCHEVHGAPGALIEAKSTEHEVCYTCHDGTGVPVTPPSTGNVEGEFAYAYHHPVGQTAVSPRTATLECRECHSPHLLAPSPHTAPGNSASNALKGTWGVEPNPWPVPKIQPRSIPAFPGLSAPVVPLGGGVSMVKARGTPGKYRVGSDPPGELRTYADVDMFYAVSGGSSRFWRYNLQNNTWQLLRDAPAAFGDGAALVWTGGDFIYATRGGNTTAFWRYKISADTWNAAPEGTPAALLGAAQAGSSAAFDGTDIWFLQGGGTRLDRYVRPANDSGAGSWTAAQAAPATVGAGGALVSTGADFVYAFQGGNATGFWRYQRSTNSWTSSPPMAAAPAGVGAGGSLVWTGADYLYGVRGGGTTSLWRYKISTNMWNPNPGDAPPITGGLPAAAPATIGTNSGSRLVYDGAGYVYALRGSTNGELWRYEVAANAWPDNTTQVAPANWAVVRPVTTEYQLCLKCHTNYASLPGAPLGAQPAGQQNLAVAINPMTVSHHPIAGPSANRYADVETMEPPWNQQQNGGDAADYVSPKDQRHDLLYCSDCHGSHLNDQPAETTTPEDPLGPHGSNQSKMLRASIVSDATNGTPLCFLCHKKALYWTNSYSPGAAASRMPEHPSNRGGHKVSSGCLVCHMGGSGESGAKDISFREYAHGENVMADQGDGTNRSPAHAFLMGDGLLYVRQADLGCSTVAKGGYAHCAGKHTLRAPSAVVP